MKVRSRGRLGVGRDDVLTPVQHSRWLTAHIPTAQLELIDASGHGFFWESPAAFNGAVRRHLLEEPG